MTEKNTKSYLETRFESFKFERSIFEFETIDANTKKKVSRTLLSSDEDDNIIIHYHLLNGSVWTFKESLGTKSKKYTRKRLKKPIGKMKYISPKGAGLLPFFPPGLIKKYLDGVKIKNLYLIEGEIKAIVGDYYGLDIIGMGSNHGFYAPKNEDRPYYKEFAPEIVELIVTCKVENIIYLTDADALVLKYAVDKDLRERPYSFFKGVDNFRDIAKRIVYDRESSLKGFFFCHVNTIHDPSSKGLDDLIENNPTDAKEIIGTLETIQRKTKWFSFLDLEEEQSVGLKKYFGVENQDNFYDVYGAELSTREFIFNSIKYYFDGEKVKVLKDLRYDNYVRIGATYYKNVVRTRLVENMIVETRGLEQWPKGEISTDLGKNAPSKVKKYDSFTNIPDFINYRKIINGTYNICAPLPYTPIEGSITNSITFLTHLTASEPFIFEKDGVIQEHNIYGHSGTMLLDFLSIIIQNPTHLLPVPCFLSRTQETGKTTFAQLLTNMFEGNSTIIQTKDFFSDFNSIWANKFIINVDEGKFEDKREAKNQIKYVSTSDTIVENKKNVAQIPVQNFSKVIVYSNDEDDFIQLEPTDVRFWINVVPNLKKKDPDFKRKLFREIPHLFHYLANRSIFHPRESRAWFAETLIQNDNFYRLLSTSKSHWKIDIDNVIEHIFDQMGALNEIRLSPMEILKGIKAFQPNTKTTLTQIRQYLKNDFAMTPESSGPYNSFIIQRDSYNVEMVYGVRGRPYVFKRENFGDKRKVNEQALLDI